MRELHQNDQRVEFYNFGQNPENHNFDPRNPCSHKVRAETAVSLVLPSLVVRLNPESENLRRPLRFRPARRPEVKVDGRGIVEATPAWIWRATIFSMSIGMPPLRE